MTAKSPFSIHTYEYKRRHKCMCLFVLCTPDFLVKKVKYIQKKTQSCPKMHIYSVFLEQQHKNTHTQPWNMLTWIRIYAFFYAATVCKANQLSKDSFSSLYTTSVVRTLPCSHRYKMSFPFLTTSCWNWSDTLLHALPEITIWNN